jgi:uncharacterized protein (DUF1499 family)
MAKLQSVEPFVIKGGDSDAAAAAWQQAQTTMRGWQRTVITEDDDTYMHCECSTALIGFTDDVELHLRPDADGGGGIIAVRSASRLGYGDMGTNKRRVEAIRGVLVAAGAVAEASGGKASLAAANSYTPPVDNDADEEALD